MRRLVISVISLIAVCVAPAFAQVEETRIGFLYPTNNNSVVALKSNLLYDAVLVPNIGLEVNLYNNWTVYGDLMYAGWELPSAHVYWNLYGAQYGLRKYFGSQARERNMSGHHVGIYGQALAYDLQVGNIGQQTTTLNMSAGVEYGYSFPVAPGLNVDVELGFGYLTGKYFEYNLTSGHDTWRGTIQRVWIGPTKASVSLVWLIKSKKKPKNIR